MGLRSFTRWATLLFFLFLVFFFPRTDRHRANFALHQVSIATLFTFLQLESVRFPLTRVFFFCAWLLPEFYGTLLVFFWTSFQVRVFLLTSNPSRRFVLVFVSFALPVIEASEAFFLWGLVALSSTSVL